MVVGTKKIEKLMFDRMVVGPNFVLSDVSLTNP